MDAHATASLKPSPRRMPPLLGLAGDELLARLVAGGSGRAFTVLYERYHQQLYRYARALLRDDADAQDALQSALTAAFSALEAGRRDAPLKPWLYRIVHNESISLLRKRRPHQELDEQAAGTGPSVQERAEQRERLSELVGDLQELPVRQRAALVMRELSGLSHEEIAVALGSTVGATRQTIFEARRSLQEFSEGRAMSCDAVCQALSDGDGRSLRARRVRAHLRGCAACKAFAAAIPERRAELHALAPPLAPLAAQGLLVALLARSSAHGGAASATGAAGAAGASGAAGKSALAVLAAKGAVGLVVIAGTTVGLTRALPHGLGSQGSGAGTSAARHARSGSAGSAVQGSARHRGVTRSRTAAEGAESLPSGRPAERGNPAGALPSAASHTHGERHRASHGQRGGRAGEGHSRRTSARQRIHRAPNTTGPRHGGEPGPRRGSGGHAPVSPTGGTPAPSAQTPEASGGATQGSEPPVAATGGSKQAGAGASTGGAGGRSEREST
jgi:RNA polymerase sigma factor (sigma-70 family)